MATSAPRKTTAKPKVKATFDVAAAEAEFLDSERPEPFTVALKDGTVVTLADPVALDWQIVASFSASDPWFFLRNTIEDDDQFKAFMDEKMPAQVVRQLFASYSDHYRLQDITSGN